MEHITNTQEVDLVAASSATIDNVPCVIFTFRNKGLFESFNISLSSKDTIRLWQDLCMMVPNKKHLEKLAQTDNFYSDYRKVIE